MSRARLIVRGVVQGVGYRANAAREAARLGVRGWVRNQGDGSVELVAEGAREVVEGLIEWARRGPRGATVDEVEARWSDEESGEPGFHIRR